MALIKDSRISKRFNIAKTLKKVSNIRLPWLRKKNSFCNANYEAIPATHPNQDEVDENALNEALEARLMELIASAPAQDKPVTIKITKVVPANIDLFAFGGNFVAAANWPKIHTRCQEAEAQTPA